MTATPAAAEDTPTAQPDGQAVPADGGAQDAPAAPAVPQPPAALPDDAYWATPEESSALQRLEPSAPVLDSAAATGLAAAFRWAGQPRESEEDPRRAGGRAS